MRSVGRGSGRPEGAPYRGRYDKDPSLSLNPKAYACQPLELENSACSGTCTETHMWIAPRQRRVPTKP